MPTISFSSCWEIQAALGANQFGANAGGPVNFSRNGGRNKTFWFFQLGRLSVADGQPFTATVPDAKERIGDFPKYASQVSPAVFATTAKRTLTANPSSSIRYMTPALAA